jgi:predicted Rossmann fold flavoprotein
MPRDPAVVVGAGPAGLFLAARLAGASGAKVLLLERGPRAGRKLLASGSGQCNITHSGGIADFLDRYGSADGATGGTAGAGGKAARAAAASASAGRFLKRALYAFTNADLEAWFLERGMSFEAEEGGKVFPASRRASEVLGILEAECSSRGVELRKNCRALSAVAVEDGFELELELEGREGAGGAAPGRLRARLLAITTGGMSYPATGSTGDGYRIAASLGHRLVLPRPALAPVVIRDFALGDLAGISFEGMPFVIRRRAGPPIRSRGDLLVTHEGFSGPGILDASRWISPGDALELDFSGSGYEAFREELARRVASAPRSLVRSALAEAGLPRRMAELFCSLASVGEGVTCASLRRESRDALARMASAYPAEVLELGAFDKAMATSGGIALDEVDPATMESRITPGLFFAGEVLDYDGDSGGYNLQAAFSTAAAAARAMAGRTASGSVLSSSHVSSKEVP